MTDIATLGIGVDTAQLEKTSKSLDKMGGAAGRAETMIEKMEREIGKMLHQVRQHEKAMGAGAAATDKFSAEMNKLSEQADIAASSLGRLGSGTRNTERSTSALLMTVRKLGVAIGSAFALGKTISTITAFEDSILRLKATSNASESAMAELESQSRLLGATSRFSAQQAADAQNFLAMAGFNVNEILSATPSVMKFASAGALGLAESADIASNVLGGMQLPVDQLDRVMNAMISTAQSANTNIAQLGGAFAHVAPLAVTASIDVETLAASVGVLGDAGIQGGRAGTGMVGVIRQLSNVSKDGEKALAAYGIKLSDVNIRSNGFTSVLELLGKANLSTADAMRIFGSESAAAALILAANVEKVKELTNANEQAEGKLDEVASILDSSVSAAFAGVTSAIDEMMLKTGDKGLTGALKTLAITTAGVISSFNGMLPEFARANGLSDEFTRNIEKATNVLKVLGVVGGMWAGMRIAIFSATQAQLAFNIAARANPYVFIATSIAAAAVMLYQFTTSQDRAAIETKRLWDNAVKSAAGYQLAAANLTGTQHILNSLHQTEIKLQEEMQAMRDKGFKKYGSQANKYIALEKEYIAIRKQRQELLDAKVGADIAEGRRQEQERIRQEELNDQQERARKLMDDILGQMNDGTLTDEMQKRQKAISNEITALERAAITWGMSANEVKLYDMALLGATNAQLDHARTEMKIVEGLEREAKARKDVRDALREQGAIERELEAFRKSQSLHVEGMGMGNRLRQQLEVEFQIQQEYAAKRLDLEAAQRVESTRLDEEAYRQSIESFDWAESEKIRMIKESSAARLEAERDWGLGVQESLQNYVDQASNHYQMAADAMTSILGSATSSVSDAMMGMITGAETVDSAFKNMAQGMARSVIQALTDMAAQWLVYQAVQLLVGRTAQMSAVTQMSANASAGVLQAGINAFASTAAIPIVGPLLAPAAMTTAISATAPLAAGVASLGMAGMAHDGIDSIPQTGTWLLEKGERVTTAGTSAKLDKTLDEVRRNGSVAGGGITINAPITVGASDGMSEADAHRQGVAMAEGLQATIRKFVEHESRPGNLLWQLYGER